MTTELRTATKLIPKLEPQGRRHLCHMEERRKGIRLFRMAAAPVHLIQKAREGKTRCIEHEEADLQKRDIIQRANRSARTWSRGPGARTGWWIGPFHSNATAARHFWTAIYFAPAAG